MPVASTPPLIPQSRAGLAPLPLIERLDRIAHPEPPFEDGYRIPFASAPSKSMTTAAAEAKAAAPESAEVKPEQAASDQLPPIVTPPDRDMRGEARKLCAPIAAKLQSLEIGDDEPELRQRHSDLLQRCQEFTEALGGLLHDCRQQKITSLTAEQESLSASCREQRIVVARLEDKYSEQLGEARKAAGRTASVRNLLNGHLNSEPKPEQWPDRSTLARWQGERARLQSALESAQAAESAERDELSERGRRLVQARAELRRLADAEEALRNRLSGEAYFDRETGLQVPPEL
jgi:hypothetical protein